MRAVVQRVLSAGVTVEGETIGRIGKGFMILLGAKTKIELLEDATLSANRTFGACCSSCSACLSSCSF